MMTIVDVVTVAVQHRILTVDDFVIDRIQTYQHQCHLQTFCSDLFIPRNSINFSQLLYTNRMPVCNRVSREKKRLFEFNLINHFCKFISCIFF